MGNYFAQFDNLPNAPALEGQAGLPNGLLPAVMLAESGGNAAAVSPKGALGAFQFMPATAKELGIDPADPGQSASGAATMLGRLLKKYNGDVPSALAAYNWGEGNVDKYGLDKAPAETKSYIARVTASMGQQQPKENYFAQFDGGPQKPTPMKSDDVAQAAASGFNKGALTYLPGLPVKAALDVADLARAGYGYLGSKLGFLSPSDLPNTLDRSQFVMSPEWIQQKIRNVGGSAVIDPNNPDSQIARAAHAAGAAVGSSVVPSTPIQAAGNAITNAIAGATGQIATDAGASPAVSMLLSMTPQALAQLPAMAVRGTVRGGSQGAQQMRDNVQALRDAGIEPTVGLAAGNRRGAGMDAFLSMTPGASGVMAKSAGRIQAGMSGQLADLADSLSPQRGTADAGTTIQQGINAYKDRLGATTGLLYDRVGKLIPQDVTFPVGQTLATGARLSADIPGLPNVSKILKPDVVPKVNSAITTDAAPRAPVTTTVPSPVLGPNGQPFTTQVTTPGRPGGITFPAMQDVRTLIGQDLNDALLTSNKNKGALKQYYGALSGDMQTAAAMTDLARMAAGQSPNVPSAVNALNRANRIYSQGQQRLETLQPFASQTAPERAFTTLEGSLGSGGTASVGNQVMQSLTPSERNVVTATIVDRMGRATPGQQNATGTVFSPETFLTNWNKMSDAGKDSAFGKQGTPIRDQLQATANAASMLRTHNKAWANPSGTAAKSTLYGTAAGIGGALMSGHPLVALGLLGGVGLANGVARIMTAPSVADWFGQPTMPTANRSVSGLLRIANLPAQQ